MASKPRLLPMVGVSPGPSVGLSGDLPPTKGTGAESSRPVALDVQQVRAELLADPEGAVRLAHDRLDVEVGAGQQPVGRALVDDREADLRSRVAQRDEPLDLDRAGAARRGLEAPASTR